METFLTCRALASYLKENILGDERGKIFEQLSLRAIYATTFTGLSIADSKLLFSEFPNILPLKYPEVKQIYTNCLVLIPEVKNLIRLHIDRQEKFLYWREFNNLDNLQRILQNFKIYITE
ncbi:MAG: hypothetical protein IJT73_03395 [Selenomonadaceae bacterium]|nr:hypothetical protein [Selenomonadaceae bacterium]